MCCDLDPNLDPMARFLSEMIQVHIPNSILTGSAVFAQFTVGSPYTLKLGRPFLPQKLPLHMGDLDAI